MTFLNDELEKFKKQLIKSAKLTAKQPLDHFPHLISYRCLIDAHDVLADASWSAMENGRLRAAESLTMPRHGFGPRPVTVLSPTTRTVYGALVERLSPALVEPSRAKGKWKAHHQFGRTGDHTHVVDLDLTACYEFVDHRDLAEELVLRSMDPDTVRALVAVLDAVNDRSRGLPQMLETSDRLADTYLAVIDRHLARTGFEAHRYVDDYRVLANSWNEANVIIEEVADRARALGLTLSSAKTTIRLRKTVDDAESAAETFLDTYFEEAGVEEDEDGRLDPYDRDYDDEALETDVAGAYVDVLDHWHDLFETKETMPVGMLTNIGGAIAGASTAETRLTDKQLNDLVFDDPLRLELTCRYLVDRIGTDSDADQWTTLETLAGMGRQSPWAKLWLLDTTAQFLTAGVDGASPGVLSWVAKQLDNPSEVVRSEAAWVTATHGSLTNDQLRFLYTRATDVTAPAIAAAAGVAGETVDKKMVVAIRDASPLNHAAVQWAGD